MGDIKQVPLRIRDITLLERIDAFAKQTGRSRNDAILALAGWQLDDLDEAAREEAAERIAAPSTAVMAAKLDEPGHGAAIYGAQYDNRQNERSPSIVSSLNVQFGPTPTRGPMLKKAAK